MNKSNLKKRCRFCLREISAGICIFKHNFIENVEVLTSLKIKQYESLSNISCVKCVHDIKQALALRDRIIKTQNFLIERLKRKQQKEKQVSTQPKQQTENQNQHKYDNDFIKCLQPLINVEKKLPLDGIAKLKTKINEVCVTKLGTLKVKSQNTFRRVEVKSKENSVLKERYTFGLSSKKPVELKCEPCKLTFSCKATYRLHIAKHNKKQCELCNKVLRADNMHKHMLIHSSDPISCKTCGATCKNIESLRGHIFYYHKSTADQYVCEDCGRAFRKRSDFMLHRKKAHGGERTFKCTQCGMAFFQKMYLVKHIKSRHEKERPHVCEYCGKGFSARHGLKTHVRVHTSEAPFICNVCNTGFRQKVSLKSHLKSKHGIKEESKSFCGVCGKGYATEFALKVHERLHQVIKCTRCTETFAEQSYLDNHVKQVHGGEDDAESFLKIEVMESKIETSNVETG